MIQVSQCNGDSWTEMEELNQIFEKMTSENNVKHNQQKTRIDMFHHEIIKKDKNHQISFRDEVIPNIGLIDINIVDNWKDYNVIQEQDVGDSCSCFIS
ncbi:unnamed protein product [Paramecium pentaurelia]|uniref:Uncharacterized protein n=1 Tax=Paramecium pentaurelia TaxID=43138 RepID=A0A8S1SR93_9CILI|nr:unnamed protein product [Paramecium pentaurelia]